MRDMMIDICDSDYHDHIDNQAAGEANYVGEAGDDSEGDTDGACAPWDGG